MIGNFSGVEGFRLQGNTDLNINVQITTVLPKSWLHDWADWEQFTGTLSRGNHVECKLLTEVADDWVLLHWSITSTLSWIAGIVRVIWTFFYITASKLGFVPSRTDSDAFSACCGTSGPLRPLRSATVDIEVHASTMEEGIAQAYVVRRQEDLTVIKSVRSRQLLPVLFFILAVTDGELEFVIVNIERNCYVRTDFTSITAVSRLWVKKERKCIPTNMVISNSSSIESLNNIIVQNFEEDWLFTWDLSGMQISTST